MFKPNRRHLQSPMFSSIESLPTRERTLLEHSWAHTFYTEVFARLDEAPFAVLYVDQASRPNVPVNILVGLEWLNSHFNWSDEEAMEHFYFDMLVRYALGLRELGAEHFDVRTLYNFRRRLLQHFLLTGEDLMTAAYKAITDQQVEALSLKTRRLRMDSTMVTSNIHNYSRLQLLVEVLGRVHRMLSETDRARLAEAFAPYMRGSSDQYVFHVRREEGPAHIGAIGEVMQTLVQALQASYAEQPEYAMLQRVFGEHFVVEPEGLRAKQKDELRADSLTAPDDPEATFRRKKGQGYKGYTTNITETCDEENPLQLVIDAQTEPNHVDDPTLMLSALPELKVRTDCAELVTDGGYNNQETATQAHSLGIEHIQTGIRGHEALGMGLDAFEPIMQDDEPLAMICPCGQRGPVKRTPARYQAQFDGALCRACHLLQECRTKPFVTQDRRRVNFDSHDLEIARRRRRIRADRERGHNPRAAIESTIGTIKRPFGPKLPVRGRFRVHVKIVGSIVLTNVRRIHRYLSRPKGTQEAAGATAQGSESILLFLRRLSGWLRLQVIMAAAAA